jgi:MFS family permease
MSLQPTLGKLYAILPVKQAFVAAMVTFEAGSILCASAPSSNIFIIGRMISGVGAAGIYAGGMIIIMTAIPLKRISIYLATLSSMWALAALIGPPLGGAFADSRRLTWRFCFWINLRKSVLLASSNALTVS